MTELVRRQTAQEHRRKLIRNLAVVLILAAIIVPVTATVTIWGGWNTQGTGAVSKVVFQQGADNIATITGGGTGSTVNIQYFGQWNWTATSALYVNNTDSVSHNITITYASSSGATGELDAMYCYANGTLFYSYYGGSNHQTTATWNNVGAGQRLVIKVTTLGLAGTVVGNTFTISFELSYT